jgi:CRISPR-associated endonuclease Cas1
LIHHLILLEEEQELRVERGLLHSGSRRVAVETLASLQCFAARVRWTQTALESLSVQCPTVFSRWDARRGKWSTFGLAARARHTHPSALWELCRLSPRQATLHASDLLYAKVCNQHTLLRSMDPTLPAAPDLRENSFARILRLESSYARFFWARYFSAAQADLFAREKRQATHPLNVALNYGYGFLYHALEWQCLASGLDPSVGIIHRLRRNRPNLVCDLIEPFRCCVELTVIRHMDQMGDKKAMAARFAEMLEDLWQYSGHRFRLRSIIRLSVEAFVKALLSRQRARPFLLHARDACL